MIETHPLKPFVPNTLLTFKKLSAEYYEDYINLVLDPEIQYWFDYKQPENKDLLIEETKQYETWVILKDNLFIGFIEIYLYDKDLHIYSSGTALLKMHRGFGYSKEIKLKTESIIRNKGGKSIRNYTRIDNEISKDILLKNGFQYIGRWIDQKSETLYWDGKKEWDWFEKIL